MHDVLIGVVVILVAYAITVTTLLYLTAEKALAYKKERNVQHRLYLTSEETVQDLLVRLDQLDPMNDMFVNEILDLANEPGVTGVSGHVEEDGHHVTVHHDDGSQTAKILPFRQVGEMEL